MNGVGEFVVFYVPEAVAAKRKRWRSMLTQRVISMIISVAIGCALWYFFFDQVGSFGPWLVGSAVVIGLVWVIVSLIGMTLVGRESANVVPGPAFAATRDGVWIAGLWLTWPEVGGFSALPRRLGQSPLLRVQSRDGRVGEVPMDYLSVLPASIDSGVRALSAGRSWIDLSRLDD